MTRVDRRLFCSVCLSAAFPVAPSIAVTRQRRIVCWGDSLTAGGNEQNYPLELGRLRQGVEIVNKGIGGQKSTQIAMRQGGRPTNLTLANDQMVPGENLIVAINGVELKGHDKGADPDFRLLSTPSRNDPYTLRGELNGIKGTLTGQGVGTKPSAAVNYTFVPDTLTHPHACRPNTRFNVDTGGLERDTSIFWIGRNNYTQMEAVTADISAMVAHLKTPRFVVLSVINGNYEREFTGNSGWKIIQELNAKIQSTYGSNFLDIRKILVEAGGPNGAFSSPEDYARDIPPTAIRSDNIHLRPEGQRLVAQAVDRFLKEKNW